MKDLLARAADRIYLAAEELKIASTVRGEWVTIDEVDRRAMELYECDMRLVEELRAASRKEINRSVVSPPFDLVSEGYDPRGAGMGEQKFAEGTK